MKKKLIADSSNIYKSVYKKKALNYDRHCSKTSKDLSEFSNQEITKIGKACSQATRLFAGT